MKFSTIYIKDNMGGGGLFCLVVAGTEVLVL